MMSPTEKEQIVTRVIRQNHFSKTVRAAKHFKFKMIVTVLVLSGLVYAPAGAQDEPPPPPVIDTTPLKVETLLFTIPLTVSDQNGRNFPGLKRENFSIYQDGEEQAIEFFLNEEAPMNVAILLDTSYSTKKVLDNIQDAAQDFVKILRPEDQAVIVGFDHRTVFFSGLTSDRKILSRAIKQARVTEVNGSNMYEAIDRVVKTFFAPLKGRKAIIALTDGMVTGRGLSAQQTLETLQAADTIFYPIIFRTNFYSSTRAGAKKPVPVEILDIMANETAGKFYEKDATKLKEAFRSIAEEMKKQYLLGFYPFEAGQGKSTGHIRVAVDRKGLIVRSKKKLDY